MVESAFLENKKIIKINIYLRKSNSILLNAKISLSESQNYFFSHVTKDNICIVFIAVT